MTTPYFVPDEAITSALLSAARRGIGVTLILPEKNDSRLEHYTCRSYFDELLEAGVRIFGFKGGLLHTKSAVVDREISLFGTVNLDVRSFWLDFEVTLCVYDLQFAERLLALQQKYIEIRRRSIRMPGADDRQPSASARTLPGCAVRCFNQEGRRSWIR